MISLISLAPGSASAKGKLRHKPFQRLLIGGRKPLKQFLLLQFGSPGFSRVLMRVLHRRENYPNDAEKHFQISRLAGERNSSRFSNISKICDDHVKMPHARRRDDYLLAFRSSLVRNCKRHCVMLVHKLGRSSARYHRFNRDFIHLAFYAGIVLVPLLLYFLANLCCRAYCSRETIFGSRDRRQLRAVLLAYRLLFLAAAKTILFSFAIPSHWMAPT